MFIGHTNGISGDLRSGAMLFSRVNCFVADLLFCLQNGKDDTQLESSLNKELEILFCNTWMILFQTIRFAEVDPF